MAKTIVTADQGGTGQSAYTVGDIVYADTTASLAKLAASTDGYVLTATGAGSAPAWEEATGTSTFYVQNFTGNGSATAFTLSQTPVSEDNTQVYVTGVYQQKNTYSVSGTTLTFGDAPADTADIEVVTISTSSIGTTTANLVTFSPDGTGAEDRTTQAKLRDVVSVKDFGATGDGATDDATFIQAAIDSLTSGGTVFFPAGTYLIGRTTGTNDNWGIKVPQSNIELKLDKYATLKRKDTIVAAADAYAILFIGTPDSDVASATENCSVMGGTFEGSDVRHAISGSAPSDQRNAIELKNTKGVRIDGVRFEKIDSAAIYTQGPGTYDYGASAYYNTTKNYDLNVTGCSLYATAHSTVGRALIHAIELTGVDGARIENNNGEWCDVLVSGDTTYDSFTDKETDTYTDTNLSASVERVGRQWAIVGNTSLNSSEHALYISGMDVTIIGNSIRVDDTATCNSSQIKVRGVGVTVQGNDVSAHTTCISIDERAINVSVTGNTCAALVATGSGGVIDLNSDGLLAYLTARSDFLTPNIPMSGISFSGNTVWLPAATQATGGYAFRVSSTDAAGALESHIRGVVIGNNVVRNAMTGVRVDNTNMLVRGLNIDGNSFIGKSFTEAAFSGSGQSITASSAAADTMTCSSHGLSVDDAVWIDTSVTFSITTTGTGTTLASGGVYYVKSVPDVNTFSLSQAKGGTVANITNDSTGDFRKLNALLSLGVIGTGDNNGIDQHVLFSNNTVSGFQYIFHTESDAGDNRVLPYGVNGNLMQYIYNLNSSGFAGVAAYNCFANNSGYPFMDRTWRSNTALGNSLFDPVSTYGYLNGCMMLASSTDVRMYYDDYGNYKAL